MEILNQYGWNTFFQQHHQINNNPDFHIGRVTSVKGFVFQLITEQGERSGELSGKLLYGTDPEFLPRPGDWVYYLDYDPQAYIMEVFPRFNALSRKSPGKSTEKQILAANIDYALIVQSLDRDFNIMRLDRYIVQIVSCGIRPVIILNKEDLISDRKLFENEVSRLGREWPVYFCSALEKSGIGQLYEQVLIPQMTHILIGSSGVGKSSLLNALAEGLNLKTSTMSQSTNKGRHTTTTRDLFMLDNGSLLIDTPGMREFGIALEEDVSSSGLFPVIEKLSAGCHYSDCMHVNESGCAVISALEKGELDVKMYASYIKLLKEQQHFEIKIEDRKRLGKQFGKMIREAKAYRDKYKY